jgi:hypothetical protein
MDLPNDFCIPYGGVYVNPQEKKTLLVRHGNEGKRYHRISHGAEVQCVGEGGEEEWGMMDAHPQLMQDREKTRRNLAWWLLKPSQSERRPERRPAATR